MDTNTSKSMELLAPAGGWEQLRYALAFGADAVYLACERFGMRQRAKNFTLVQMPEVAAYVHERGAKLHVTCNTVMHESDLDVLPRFLQGLDAAGVDALIIGDLGAFQLAREHAPHVDLHVSTQASVSNSASALAWYRMGAKRIVCARELSLEHIARMRAELPDDLELEAFAHGSMCMAYSGRCLVSDFLTGRSGLTGHCTQPCRWGYALHEETRPGQYFPIEEDAGGTYLLNSKDLCMLEHLDALAAAGVDSVKIEGRNKKAFYVATVVNAYRAVLDGADPAIWRAELDTVSHRPYHTGFYFGPARQTPESDEYLRGWEWAAEVLGCENAGQRRWKIIVNCRNRFSADDELWLLSPRESVRNVHVESIEHVPEPEFAPDLRVPVQTANRNMERYELLADCPAKPGGIIRVRRED